METALRCGQTVLWVALTYKVARNAVWPYIVRTVPEKYRTLHESKMRVELRGGGAIQIGSLDLPDNLRGQGTDLCLIIVDEAAFTRDYDLEYVLDPMRLDNGAPLIGLCSPNGTRGWFYRYFRMGQDRSQTAIRSFQMPTWTNPHLPDIDAQMAKKRSTLPSVVFRQEYGAEFVDSSDQVFRGVRLCALASRREALPHQQVGATEGRLALRAGSEYFAGIDFARSGSDYTVVVVLERDSAGGLRLAWMERWGREEDRRQVDRIGAILEWCRPVVTLAEENSFGGVYVSWLREEYDVDVTLFKTTAQSKGPLVLQLAAAFEGQRLEIWPETEALGETLIDELSAYQRTQSEGGYVSYSAPDGLHDDMVMALALAYRAAEGDPSGGERADGFGEDLALYTVPGQEGLGSGRRLVERLLGKGLYAHA